MINDFWIKLLQKERQVHLQDTLYEMACISAIIYIGAALTGLVAILFPAPIGMDLKLIVSVCVVAILFGIIFYFIRFKFPIWLAVSHIFLGVPMVGLIIWAGHGPSASMLALLYLMSSIYSFHFFNFYVGYAVVVLAGACFAFVAVLNQWQGWQSMTVLLLGCAGTVGVILNLMVKRLHALATTDSLTGLFNRNTWDTLFEQELVYLSRRKVALSLMLIDLNRFKVINDTQGHQAGDLVLKKTADAIKKVMRESDITARWGGDEFIVLLRDCNLTQAKTLEIRLHERLSSFITASVGTTEYQQGDTTETMLSRADKVMYENKARQTSVLDTESIVAL